MTRQQCSHYSNFHLAGSLPTPEQARTEYATWSHRLHPKRFALLGGEPALNLHLVEQVRIAREHWPNTELMLVSNGFFLHRHPDLPKNAYRNQLPTRNLSARDRASLHPRVQKSPATRLAMAFGLSKSGNQGPPIASRLNEVIQHRCW